MTTAPTPRDDHIERAIALAGDARKRSYNPYSGFDMGAAVVDANGAEIGGVLIENVSLGLAMCAERVALFTAVANDVKPYILSLSSKRTAGALTFPCGACCQVALEIAGPDLLVVAVDTDGVHDQAFLRDLVPRAPHRFTHDPDS